MATEPRGTGSDSVVGMMLKNNKNKNVAKMEIRNKPQTLHVCLRAIAF